MRMRTLPSTYTIAVVGFFLISLMSMKSESSRLESCASHDEEIIPSTFLGLSESKHPPLSIELHSSGLNEFELRITDYDETTLLNFSPPIQLLAWIDEKEVLVYSISSKPSNIIEISEEGIQNLLFEETSIPSSSSGTYTFQISSSHENYQDLQTKINIQVGCTDLNRVGYMECVLNCERWGVTW